MSPYLYTCLSSRVDTVYFPSQWKCNWFGFSFVSISKLPSLYFLISSTFGRKKSHHLFIGHTVEKNLSHYPGEAWDESVWDCSSCLINGELLFLFNVPVHFLNHLALSFSVCSLCLRNIFCLHPLAFKGSPFRYLLLFVDHYHERLSDGWWSMVE